MANADRRSYDVGASQEAQGNLQTVMASLEAMIGQVRRGPPGCRVQELECEPMDEGSRFARFEVVR